MADLKVVPFTKKPEISADNSEVIRLLTDALEHVRKGSCHSVALLLIDGDGNALDCWHNGGRPYVLVGALESLKLDFINANIERR
ncbi:hypothetical protein [Pseudescherichia sp.]|uniref:hypothetical protein n=1 Tax=Pseudescherichia sp. TaxID=2055881 RepID=UPI00289F990B|nr:hypothetical protein [Pseudescherichia sp.]